MTYEERDEIATLEFEAGKISTFWENNKDALDAAIRAFENFEYKLLPRLSTEEKAVIDSTVHTLDNLSKYAEERISHWNGVIDEAADTYEAAVIDEDEDGDDGYPPYEPYDCCLDPVPEPFDYVAMGMGI